MTINDYLIGYSEKSKGYRFFCSNHGTRIVESDNARFIKNCHVRSLEPWKVDNQKTLAETSPASTSFHVVPLVVLQLNNI